MPVPSQPSLSRASSWEKTVLSWTAATGATGYRLKRKVTSEDDSTAIVIYDGTALTHTDYPLHHDYSTSGNSTRSWTWILVAYNADGDSTDDDELQIMPGVSDGNAYNMSILHPAYNDGADQVASHPAITYDGTTLAGSGASDDDLNAAALYYDQARFQEI